MFGRKPVKTEEPPEPFSYKGMVEGITKWDGGETRGYWILTEGKAGVRKSKLVGNPGSSPFAVFKQAEVEAWIAGGPFPSEEEPYEGDPDPGDENDEEPKVVHLKLVAKPA